MMGYLLLTGATGLLGRYLLRNLLLNDTSVAVVVRGNRLASAWQRMESVIAELEDNVGRTLPRPIVLEGELTKPDLGLNEESLDWLKRHCTGVLHNAASLSFQKGERHEEPWVTNVTGTQRVLELMRSCGVRELHYVSTAYVCGQRHGQVRETELNCGQEFGNDYEASKLEAEQMVRTADWLEMPTIYRPAIIVGDSRTAFTNTFHGFYTPLQIVHAMAGRADLSAVRPQSLVEILGLQGSERKNLVPVDWVAAAITTLMSSPRHRGQVYHLTPGEPTPVSLLCDVFAETIRQPVDHEPNSKSAAGQRASMATLAQSFRSQMSVYQAYWRDDPHFDASNTLASLPELPCPTVDRAMLQRLCKFAVDNRFWWSRGNQTQPKFDLDGHLQSIVRQRGEAADDGELSTCVNLRVSGSGGGDWRVRFDQDRPKSFAAGVDRQSVADFHTSVDVWMAMVERRLGAREALERGAVSVETAHLPLQEAAQLLAQLCSP